MSKHRRPHFSRARSTIVKTAAAMGVATAIAAGAHSVSDTPPNAQASSEPHRDTVDLMGVPSGSTSETPGDHAAKDTPSDLATDSARAPQAVGDQHPQARHTASAATPSYSAEESNSAPAPDPTPSRSSGASTPSQPPASSSPAPSDPSTGTGTGDSSVVGGVVGGVGDVVGGVLGGVGGLLGG